MISKKNSFRSKKAMAATAPSSSPESLPEPIVSCSTTGSSWSGYETIGMRRARCSLLLQDEIIYDAMITKLSQQCVYIDRSNHQATTGTRKSTSAAHATHDNIDTNPALFSSPSSSTSSSEDDDDEYSTRNADNESSEAHTHSLFVDFNGATILQLYPSMLSSTINGSGNSVMPITITVAGKCVLTPENYVDFHVMMRTKQQSCDMNIPPNGTYDWPDIASFLLCPVCGNTCSIPRPGDRQEHEYWMVFYPLIQIATRPTNETDDETNSNNNSNNSNATGITNTNHQMVLCTRTICRLTCLDCMDDLLEGLSLNVIPGGYSKERSVTRSATAPITTTTTTTKTTTTTTTTKTSPSTAVAGRGLSFSLPVVDILAEAGSVSFLEGGPPRPDTHQHLDDILDAWTLYNLWESSGAWEALQNDYKLQLTKSVSPIPMDVAAGVESTIQTSSTKRIGQKCGNHKCHRIHGRPMDDAITGSDELCRLGIKCQDCHSELYCSKVCRDVSRTHHADACRERRKLRDDRREHRRCSSKHVHCDTCARKFSCTKMKKCSACRQATYCSVDCQKMDWERHKIFCKR